MMLVKLFLAVFAVFLITTGCEKAPVERVIYIVTDVGDCTESTGGWGGSTGRCRVTFEDNSKATVIRPVDIGDEVSCHPAGRSEWHCRVK